MKLENLSRVRELVDRLNDVLKMQTKARDLTTHEVVWLYFEPNTKTEVRFPVNPRCMYAFLIEEEGRVRRQLEELGVER